MITEISDKEYFLQRTKRGYRCISWHPHYITTEWTKQKENALFEGDMAIDKYYKNIQVEGAYENKNNI